jgi:putative sigma-54 modulation protein
MEVIIRPKNFKLSSSIENQIRKRVERLPRHLDNLQSAEVILSQQPTHLTPQRFQYVAQLTLHTSHNLLRSEVADPELLTAVDQVLSRLNRQIERFKGRHYRRHKGSPGLGKSSADYADRSEPASPRSEAPSVVEMAAPAKPARKPRKGEQPAPQPESLPGNGLVDDEDIGSIVRVKRFNVKPMYPEEAIEQMELLGHSFFLFWNAADERISVLYRRKDGDYGLLEPELT